MDDGGQTGVLRKRKKAGWLKTKKNLTGRKTHFDKKMYKNKMKVNTTRLV